MLAHGAWTNSMHERIIQCNFMQYKQIVLCREIQEKLINSVSEFPTATEMNSAVTYDPGDILAHVSKGDVLKRCRFTSQLSKPFGSNNISFVS